MLRICKERAQLAAALACLGVFLASAPAMAAQGNYPSRSITMVVPFAPGGGADLMARLVAPTLAKELGQTVIVDNKGGASGQIGEQYIATSAPDGYNVLLDASSFITNQYLYPNQPFSVSKSFIPIGVIARFRMIAVVSPKFSAKNVADLVELAKVEPGKVMYASGGVGSGQDLTGRLFMAKTGVKMNMVPYKGGGPAMVDVMGGQVPLLFGVGSSAITPVRAGSLRAIAITGQGRLPVLPDVPTFQEQGVNLDFYEWNALYVPAKTPADVIAKLRAALAKTLAVPEVAKKIAELGGELVPGGTEGSLKLIEEHSNTVRKIIEEAGIHGTQE
jgi:tripartite-type tricarboxylate transporter receptor subunit TctC